ncbi:MAG: hypothetical protein M0015_03465 [Betaproteobacteria bacterium]|nr:hypothetical protein [Betaproteobacteria bacterium]
MTLARAAAPAPVREAAPALEAPSAQPAVQEDVRGALAGSGLVMIETAPGKAAPVAEEPAPAPLGRPRRVRPQASADESLVQVETRK